MSFFRNLRSTITRGRSSSRDTTPVCNSSRPDSVISSLNSSRTSKRRDSIESRSDSLLNRSDTFILDEPHVTPCHSNCSTLEKKSKKSKVLEKFSTFTKRKKNPMPPNDSATFEHHPSDNATNTYYKWQAEGGGNSLDYDSENDPFNFLYEQQTNVKSLQNKEDPSKTNNAYSANSFDSSTYRKSKLPTDLRRQLKPLKDPDSNSEKNNQQNKIHIAKYVEADEDEGNDSKRAEDSKAYKYKTVTLNSFRRSFREKFLQQHKEAAAYNPAWFVEVEANEKQKDKRQRKESSKENRSDLLVFENENYRPDSKSPVRDLSNRKELRTTTRSPVKRNDTFKIDRLSHRDEQSNPTKSDHSTGSIHIELKNSITPHMPGRMVPLGVAKPMPSQLTYSNYYRKFEPTPLNTNYSNKYAAGITTTRLNNHSPVRSSGQKSQSPSRNVGRAGRYQTLVQIKNEKSHQASPVTVHNSRFPTRIPLEASKSDKKSGISTQSAAIGKRFYSSHVLSRPQPLKQTYFGETLQTARITHIPLNLNSSTGGLKTTRQTATSQYNGYKYHTPSIFCSTSSLTAPPAAAEAATISTRTTPAHSVSNIYSSSNNNLSYNKNYQQQQQLPQHQQTRFAVTGQRRSRSPIKIPWR